MPRLHIPYLLLLLTTEWQEKRLTIIQRDNKLCTNCGKAETVSPNISGLATHSWEVPREAEILQLPFRDKNGEFIKVLNPYPGYDYIPSDKQYILHVHHSYYIHNLLPWEYPEEDLQTLCQWCHLAFHQNNQVPIYSSIHKRKIRFSTICDRCEGTGELPHYHYFKNGVCFQCDGRGYL